LVAKRKNEVGRVVDQVWVFGCYDKEMKIGALEIIQNKTQATLFPIIQRYVRPGTLIISDCAPMYVDLKPISRVSHITPLPVNPPYLHQWVNHKENFTDPQTQATTNHVEVWWKNCKKKNREMSGTTKERLPSYLDEFQWREISGKKTNTSFDNLLNQISLFYPVNN
jgi:hypothetical protein